MCFESFSKFVNLTPSPGNQRGNAGDSRAEGLFPDTEEACKDKAQGCSLELDRGLQTGRCHSLCSTSALVFEFVPGRHAEPSESEQWDSLEHFQGWVLVELTAMCHMLGWT